jgi:hypothetical protein
MEVLDMKRVLLAVFVLAFVSQAFAAFNLTSNVISTSSDFSISGLQQTPDRVYPGDEVRLRFYFQNVQRDSANVVLNVLSPFPPQTHAYVIGILARGEQKEVVFDFEVPATAQPGNYLVFVYAIDYGGGQAEVARIPLVVNEASLSNGLIASISSLAEVHVGDSVEIPVLIRDVGSPAEDVIVQMLNSSSVLMPIGSDRFYIPSINANGTTEVRFRVGVSASATPGFYPLPLRITYKVDKVVQPSISQSLGLKVDAESDLLITSETAQPYAVANSQTALSISIVNVGDTPVRGVYAVASSEDFRFGSASDKFVGTLNLDDSATMDLTISPARQLSAGEYPVTIKVSYKDALNTLHVQTQAVNVRVLSGGTGAQAGGLQAQAAGISGTQRFGRSSQELSVFGIPVLYIIVAVVIAGAAYGVYRWRKRRRKKIIGGK